jgi:hypothetical protein
MGKNEINIYSSSATSELQYSGVDPGFQVRGAHLIKLHRVEGGAKIFGVFCVKNHDFMPKNLIFSNFRGGGAGGMPPPGSAPDISPLEIAKI